VTIEELRALVTAAKDASTISWQGVIFQEETTGRLKQLNDNYAATLRLYDLATEQQAALFPKRGVRWLRLVSRRDSIRCR
jgi:hypothetical protein